LDWRHLRQQGFLTLSIVLSGAFLVTVLAPIFDLRGALVLMAVVALLLGWIP
jgi:hypothetical protein